jgi:hypothetical protein
LISGQRLTLFAQHTCLCIWPQLKFSSTILDCQAAGKKIRFNRRGQGRVLGQAGEGSVPIPVEADEVVQIKAEHASGGCGCSEGMNSCWTAQQNMHALSGCTMVQKRCFGPQTSSRLLRKEKFQVTTRSIHKLNGDAIEEQILDDESEKEKKWRSRRR